MYRHVCVSMLFHELLFSAFAVPLFDLEGEKKACHLRIDVFTCLLTEL